MRRSRSWLLEGLVAGVALLAVGCSSKSAPVGDTSLQPVADRQPAPDFALKDANGRTVRLSDYRGKVVLLNFWATWCGPCKMEIPWFMELEKEHKSRGFAVLGVSMDEGGWDAVKPFVEQVKVNYRILLGNDSVAMLYGGVNSLPTSFLIDRNGKIATVHIGLVSKQDYENDIKALLAQKASAAWGLTRAGMPALLTLAR